jgi:hypothetical protein
MRPQLGVIMAEDKTTVRTVPIEELVPDKENANRGTPRGRKLLKESLKRNGAGRSILLDKDNVIVAGNKTAEEAKKQGFKKVVVVEADGETLVAVKRTDLDANSKKGRDLAIADNRVAEVDLSWDPEALRAATEIDLSKMWDPLELDRMLNQGKNFKRADRIDTQPPPRMIWTLIGVPYERFDMVQEHLAALEQVAEISVQSARNE